MNPIIPNDVLYLYIITDKLIGLGWLLMLLSMMLFIFHIIVYIDYLDYENKSVKLDDAIMKYNYTHGKKIRFVIALVFVLSIIILTLVPKSDQLMLLILNNYMTPDTLNSLSDNGKDILNEYINIIKSGMH
jgi:hypothetical protein